MSAPEALVIGGGWAGITAAAKLAKAGWKVALYERRRLLGGRSGAFWDEQFGEWLDGGPHMVIGGYSASLNLIDEWGAGDKIDFDAGREIPWIAPGGRIKYLRSGEGEIGALIAFLVSPVGKPSQRWRSLKAILDLKRLAEISTLNTGTLRDYLSRQSVRPGDCDGFWETVCVAVMNCPPESAGLEPFVRAVKGGLLGGGFIGRLGVPTCSLYKLVCEPAYKYLVNLGVEVRLGRSIKSVEPLASKNGFRVETIDELTYPQCIIAAVDPFDLKRLFTTNLWNKLSLENHCDFTWNPIIAVHCTFDRPVMHHRMAHLSGTFTQWLVARGEREAAGWRRVSAVISDAPGKATMDQEQIVNRVLDDVSNYLPSAGRVKVIAKRFVRTVRATPIFDGISSLNRPPVSTNIGNFFISGDWTATGLPATIEGAVRSGEAAAAAAIDELV